MDLRTATETKASHDLCPGTLNQPLLLGRVESTLAMETMTAAAVMVLVCLWGSVQTRLVLASTLLLVVVTLLVPLALRRPTHRPLKAVIRSLAPSLEVSPPVASMRRCPRHGHRLHLPPIHLLVVSRAAAATTTTTTTVRW